VLVSEYGPGSTDAPVRFNKQITYTNGQNDTTQDIERERAKKELKDAVTSTETSTTGPLDVIGAVNDLEQHLEPLSQPDSSVEVVIVGDAVQTAAPIDLSSPVQLADTKTSIDAFVAEGLLRRGDCAGWRVHMVAPSVANNFDAVRDVQLREFFRQFWAYCGGALVLYDTDLTAFPAPGDEVDPAEWTQTGDLPVVLPAAILFDGDEEVLRRKAEPTLNEVVTLLSETYPTATADVVGHTAVVPGHDNSEATAETLSRARAEAVVQYLEAHGIDRSRLYPAGRGDHEPIASNDTEDGRHQNRRVEITLHPEGEGS
jgi:outer membrane protein OmpA-like peptidoglycan-associated protein